MPMHSIHTPLTSVSTVAEYPLGVTFERINPSTQSEEVWIYVFNDEASASFVIGQ